MSAPVAPRDTDQYRVRFAAVDLLLLSGETYRKEGEPAWRPLCILANIAFRHGIELEVISLALNLPNNTVLDAIAVGYRFLD